MCHPLPDFHKQAQQDVSVWNSRLVATLLAGRRALPSQRMWLSYSSLFLLGDLK
jgi:hypothetical protein